MRSIFLQFSWLLAPIIFFNSTTELVAATDISAARVISIYGTGEYRTDENQTWLNAQVEQDLFAGNIVRTGSYSRMGILFHNRTQVRLNEESVLLVKDVDIDGSAKSNTVLRLDRGRAWTRTRMLPGGLHMETPSATAAIRGTDWDLVVNEDGSSVITVLSGEVDFFNNYGRVTVARGEQAQAEVGKAPVKRLIVQPEDRVQWVNAYTVDPLRSVMLHGGSLEELGQLANNQPVSASAMVTRADALADLGRWREAADQYDAVLKSDRDNQGALLGLGFVALHDHEVDKAARYFRQVSPGTAAAEERLALGYVSVSIQREQLGAAYTRLNRLLGGPLTQPAAYLMLSDIGIFSGDIDRAAGVVQEGLRRFPDDPRLYSQLARVYLLAGHSKDSWQQAEEVLAENPDSYEGHIVLGDAARIEGEEKPARNAYSEAIEIKPHDDRGWHGLGVVNSEREEVREGRSNLMKSLELNQWGAGYQGELGTLEVFANEFSSAEQAFGKALEQSPEDYVAIVGLGVLELKRGNKSQALEYFLRAQTLEPRYARAHMYAAVAYYQMGHTELALEALSLATGLDDKDPLPHFLASIIYTDLLRPADATVESRKALELLPYLKSLNQLANDQQGTTNLGQAYAFWGMEEWAQSFAQESYFPFWAGSHLFLAERYNGLFNKNSELFQGFLSDPLAFGASNRFNSLMTSPGNYFTGSLRGTYADDVDGYSPMVEFSGLHNEVIPLSYYLAFERFDLDFDEGPYDTDTYTAALGIQPRHDIGLFLFADRSELTSESEGTSLGASFDLDDDLTTERFDLGGHIKLTPRSHIWLKAGYFESDEEADGILVGDPVAIDVDVDQWEYALRHTVSIGDRHEISWGVETGDRNTDSLFDTETLAFIPPFGVFTLFTTLDYRYDEEFLDFYVSDRFQVNDKLLLQLDLAYQDQDRHADYIGNTDFFFGGLPILSIPDISDQNISKDDINPRIGLVYTIAPEQLIRFAYQDWMRPRSFSTLGSVATAGIPLDDRLVAPGGELERMRAQIEWGFSESTFVTAYLDYKDIDSNRFDLTPFQLNELESLQKLRSRDLGSLARDDMLEFVNVPDYESGRVKTAGMTANQILNREWSVYGRYIYRDSENTGNVFSGADIPYLPEHTAAIGATYVRPDGWYFGSRVVYRTKRFTDEANTNQLDNGFDGAFDLYRQSEQKNWLLRFSVDNIIHPDLKTQYTAEVSLRL